MGGALSSHLLMFWTPFYAICLGTRYKYFEENRLAVPAGGPRTGVNTTKVFFMYHIPVLQRNMSEIFLLTKIS